MLRVGRYRLEDVVLRAAALLSLIVFGTQGRSEIERTMGTGASFPRLELEATTDLFLSALDIAHPSEHLREAFRLFPTGARLLFVIPASYPSALQTYYTIMYLAYPRPMSAVLCSGGPGQDTQIFKQSVPNVEGLVLFDPAPARRPAGARRIGPHLFVAPFHGAPVWTSFCR